MKVNDNYRPAVFWSFNDEMEEKHLREQLAGMLEAGVLGGFLHSRVGRVTPYMSEEWMDRIQFCCEQAKELDTHLWLYDEDGFPSGTAGGEVLKENPSLVGKALCLIPKDDAKHYEVLHVYKETTYQEQDYLIALCKLWYVDLLKQETTDTFINVTHERYRERLGQYFGKELKGFFSDEFCYVQQGDFVNVPFTEGFETYFEEQKGYSLIDCLEKLFFDIEGYETVRFDFYDTITKLFVDNYTRRCNEWCNSHDMIFTGHLHGEDTLTGQIEKVGAVMPHYVHMEMPGIDKLGSQLNQAVTVKQVTSVAEQLGKQSLCESLGCIGHQSGPKEMKRITDWLNVLGISFINPHLTLYSMRGERKRDYPPNIAPVQPWFCHAREYHDHVARMCEWNDISKLTTDVLVLHPMSSVWTEFSPLHRKHPARSIWEREEVYDQRNYLTEVETYEKPFFALTDKLLDAGIDFHYGDETVMEEYARFEEILWIGQQSYRTVIVPPVKLLKKHTLQLLHELSLQFGKEAVVFIERFPSYIGNENANFNFEQYFSIASNVTEAVAFVQQREQQNPSSNIRVIDLTTGKHPKGIFLSQRKTEDGKYGYFLCNPSEEKSYQLALRISGVQKPVAVDTMTGTTYYIDGDMDCHDFYCEVRLEKSGSLFILSEGQANATASYLQSGALFGEMSRHVIDIHRPSVTTLCPNVLVLDRVDFRTKESEFLNTPLEHLWHTQFYPMEDGTEFEAEYHFEILTRPQGEICALIEVARNLEEVLFNGQPAKILKTKVEEGCFDFSYDKVELRSPRVGRNTITIRGRKQNNIVGVGFHCAVVEPNHKPTELENIFICGDFSVENVGNGQYVIHGDSGEFQGGLIQNGFPFYAGTLGCYAVVPSEARYMVINADAAVIHLQHDGKQIATSCIAPFVFDVREYNGKEIQICLETTVANLFGPLHLEDRKNIKMIGPALMVDVDRYCKEPELFEYGLYSICFVK